MTSTSSSMATVSEPSATTAQERRFLANLAALRCWAPDLARRIDEVPDTRLLELVPTRSGHLTAVLETPGGPTLLHSRYDPVAEAARLIDSVDLEGKFCFVINGFGLGYHIRELHERLSGRAVIVVTEPSLPLLASAFRCVDLSEAILSQRLVILDRLDKAEIHQRLRPHNTLMMLGAQFVVHPPSRQVAGAFHAEARRLLTDYVAYNRMMLLTLVGNSEITCRNIAYNLPTYLSTPPIDVLCGRFQGHPGIVIAAGPSLRRNIDQLPALKGRAVLCAVQTVFKPLLARGIVPDFVTSLDFHAQSRQFFHGLTDFHDVHLIAEPKVTWHVLDHYGGPISLVHSDFADLLIGPELARRAGLRPGATVAHLAFYLLHYMGCDPIIFVGQDLAFTGHCFYVPGVEAHRTWASELNRFNSLETKEWERIVRNRAILRKVPDIEGRQVYTDELLGTYLEQFEKDIAALGVRVIDATEGGARIRGTEVLSLHQATERHCTRPIPAELFAYDKKCHNSDTTRVQAARQEIRARMAEIEELGALCDEMLTVLKELEGLTDDRARFNQRMGRVDELRAKVKEAERAYRVINSATQLAELQRFTADRKLERAGTKGAERAKRQLARDIRFVSAFREGVDKMTAILGETLRRFDEHLEKHRP